MRALPWLSAALTSLALACGGSSEPAAASPVTALPAPEEVGEPVDPGAGDDTGDPAEDGDDAAEDDYGDDDTDFGDDDDGAGEAIDLGGDDSLDGDDDLGDDDGDDFEPDE